MKPRHHHAIPFIERLFNFASPSNSPLWLPRTENTLVFVLTRCDGQLGRKRRQLERVVACEFVVARRRRTQLVLSLVVISEAFRERLGEEKVDRRRDRNACILKIVVVPVSNSIQIGLAATQTPCGIHQDVTPQSTYQNRLTCRAPESHKMVTICRPLPRRPHLRASRTHATRFTAEEEWRDMATASASVTLACRRR
jgi:hypothetical protein